MELKNLRTFQAVVDQGSYQRAAERLGYTQSTITVQIQQLEEELGVPLFERVGRRMVLTEAGERALPQARELLEAADRLLECGRMGRVPAGTLRVDMAETLLCYRMQPVIRAFRERALLFRPHSISWSAASSSSLARGNIRSPASVSTIRRPTRSKRGTPISPSSC